LKTIVLDAGALIAAARNDRDIWSMLKAAAQDRDRVLLPSTALAQVWRGSPRQAQLARALSFCAIAEFDPLARSVGELCGRTKTSDVCDAHVAIVAGELGDFLFTSDPDDLRRLMAAWGKRTPALLRC
jgi:hypothetical protein